MTEDAVLRETNRDGRAPDATIDEVGVPGEDIGFSGAPIHSRGGNGHGTGDPGSAGWAGWSGYSGGP